ncbi:PilN family type IVB pilus formation outer membrane protein [Chromobacterium sp. ATCC 53434]|uniref:PilN family type IVB pilus formation outer membrane protein n=1 Tax=Chromobacterium TaxID=535 RepID=UPI000C77E199|nr:PilN family type IVB pilus formation outer membrane protein [Chromobacterium sp. ATCC 53434]AUH51482.1 PilN family type IVB pilus formation outer membrane protein [Chromobacterium sp. ATCC 53434]
MKKIVAAVCGVSVLSACGTPGMLQKTDDRVSAAQTVLRSAQENLSYRQPQLMEHDSGAWFAQRSVVMDEIDSLPARFGQPAGFSSGRALPLSLIAEQVSKEQGVTIRLARDIFGISPSKQQGAGGNASPGGMPMPPTGMPPLPGGMGGAMPGMNSPLASAAMETEPRTQINYSGTLRGLLDAVANRTGTNWSYRNGVVEFSRLMTRTFQIKTMPGVSSYTAKVGKSSQSTSGGSGGGSGGGSSGGATLSFGSDSSVSMTSELRYWDKLADTVNSMLSPLGKAMPSEMTSSITVTDSADVVDRVRRYIDGENAVLGRQVNLSVQVFSIKLNENSASGVDWSLVYRSASSGWGSTFTMPAGAGDGAGVFGITMNSGQFSGSKILLQALSQQGRVSTVVNTNVVTLNNQPAPVAVTNNQGYLASITSTAGTNGSAPSTGLTPGLITTGFVMNLMPTLLDNRSVMLQVQIDLSELIDITKVTSGDNTIQTPNTSSVQTMQRASLKSGQTLILSGFRRAKSNTARKGVVAYEGGTKSSSQDDEEIIVVISPQLTEGV